MRRVEERRAESEFTALARARDLFEAGRLDDARKELAPRADWRDHTRELAEELLKDVESHENR